MIPLTLPVMYHAIRAVHNGQGFVMPAQLCADEDRSRPNCLFRPSGNCGSLTLKRPGSRPGGTAPANGGIATELAAWPSELSSACRKAAASLGIQEPRCAGGLEAWRVVAKLLLRLQPDIAAHIEREYLDHFEWARVGGEFAAVHIRRGDKLREATPVATCAYAERLAQLSDHATGLHVFVATDAPDSVGELRRCPPSARLGWHVHSLLQGQVLQNTRTAQPTGRAVVYRLWADIAMLVRAKWSVVTFSSNMGRLVQLLRDQPEATCASLDAPAWYDWVLAEYDEAGVYQPPKVEDIT